MSQPSQLNAESGGVYDFYSQIARVINSGQSRSVVVAGDIHGLYYSPDAKQRPSYVPLVDFLCDKCSIEGITILVYELNGPIRLLCTEGAEEGWGRLKKAWISWKWGVDHDQLVLQALTDKGKQHKREALEEDFQGNVNDVVGRPTFSLEFLRQLALCSRSKAPDGHEYLSDSLLIIIEAADMMLPAGSGQISQLPSPDRHRVAICQDWFADPGFMNGKDSVILLSESQSLIHPLVSKLPQVLSIPVDTPDGDCRRHYIDWFTGGGEEGGRGEVKLWAGPAELAHLSAGLSIHALRQLLIGAVHSGQAISASDVIAKVESFIQTQLGEEVVEFKKPAHTLDDVIGFTELKAFIHDELLPRFRSTGPDALPGAAVAGPIGGGKTFIFEAVAAALGLPVLVLKNIRSQWFGQTDVIFERLRRVLESLGKVVIFVDEADTQFGGVGPEAHATERRLTGKVQQMMSDTKLRGKVIWLLMTARIHRLSPDIRRPGRVGDLIIPVLDPKPGSDDHRDFVRWVIKGAMDGPPSDEEIDKVASLTESYSAASFASLRSNFKAKAISGSLDVEAIERIVHDLIPPAIASTRRYQTLQALINCTRRSLLPDPKVSEAEREAWQREIRELEMRGVS